MTTKHPVAVKHAAEMWTAEGAIGNHVEVLAGEVRDYGGNMLFAGSADDCVYQAGLWELPTRLVPTEWREVGEIVSADHTWQMVMAE